MAHTGEELRLALVEQLRLRAGGLERRFARVLQRAVAQYAVKPVVIGPADRQPEVKIHGRVRGKADLGAAARHRRLNRGNYRGTVRHMHRRRQTVLHQLVQIKSRRRLAVGRHDPAGFIDAQNQLRLLGQDLEQARTRFFGVGSALDPRPQCRQKSNA